MTTVKKTVLPILIGALLLATIACAVPCLNYYRQTIRNVTSRYTATVTNAAVSVKQSIDRLSSLVTTCADTLATEPLSSHTIQQQLKTKDRFITGFGVIHAPSAKSSNNRLNSYYYVEKNGSQEMVTLSTENSLVYQYKSDWYQTACSPNGRYISPYQDPITGDDVIAFAAPFYNDNNQQPAGVVFATISMNHIQHIIKTLYQGQEGYWFILDTQKERLYNSSQIINQVKELILKNSFQQISTLPIVINGVATQATVFTQSLQVPSLVLGSLFAANEIPFDDDTIRQQLILLITLVTMLGIVSLYYLMTLLPNTLINLWAISLSVTTVLILGLSGLWAATAYFPDYKEELTPVLNKKTLYAMLEQSTNSQEPISSTDFLLNYRYTTKSPVPTGLFITSLELHDTTNTISIVGYVWQRYFRTIHDEVQRGFLLPQAEKLSLEKVIHKNDGKEEIIIWHVIATLHQQLSYVRYPFDVKDLQLQIWHKDFDKNQLLVPDLDSYKLINRTLKPGLSPAVFLKRWYINDTFFGYKKEHYNSIFGLYNYGPFGIYKQHDRSYFPELYFNITIQRKLIDTLISNLLPLITISFVLFMLLITSTWQGYAIIGTCSTVLFSSIFTQSLQFRSTIATNQLIYFDYFYFVLYIAILIVLLLSIIYLLDINISFIKYRKNLLAKLLYWPLIISLLFIVTVIYLY